MESPKKSDNAEFDIRNLMNYDLIRRSLAKHPTELCLFEVTCILINNNLKDNNLKEKKPK